VVSGRFPNCIGSSAYTAAIHCSSLFANALFDEVTSLLQCRLRGGHVPQAIQEAEVMDLTDVPRL